ncbi:MAG: hypothetical protein HC893_09550, partial [Chloroflexaceae bacterium]|nr:hypothetical protein [Chloroflexaceae bacterium]
GSVRQVLDEAGQPLVGSELTYTPFGIPQSGAQPALFGFTGEVQSIETGLVYLRARWYDPASGTFLGARLTICEISSRMALRLVRLSSEYYNPRKLYPSIRLRGGVW